MKLWLFLIGLTKEFLDFNKTENCLYMREGGESILGTFESKKILKIHISL